MRKIIPQDKSLIVDCFVNYELAHVLIRETTGIPDVGGYKFDALKFMRKGLEKWMEMARNYTEKPIIVDGQKWGTDIPKTGDSLMRNLKDLKAGGIILFPYSGPITQAKWTEAAQKYDLPVLIGGEMTHEGIKKKEGGYFTEEDFIRMYLLGVKMGVRNFVVPGNKPKQIELYKRLIEYKAGEQATYFSPGFKKIGEIENAVKVAGRRFNPIVGGLIYESENMHQAALDITSKLH